MTLHRPLALVTGASRGIGAAVAAALAPTHRVLLGGRDVDRLKSQAATLPDAQAWPVDLTDAGAVQVAADALAAETGGRLDVLVHSAGVAELGTVAESEPAAWRSNFEVNVMAPVTLTRALLPALRAARGDV